MLVDVLGRLGVGLNKLNHLICLPLAVRRLGHKQHAVREPRVVELRFSQLRVKCVDERTDIPTAMQPVGPIAWRLRLFPTPSGRGAIQ